MATGPGRDRRNGPSPPGGQFFMSPDRSLCPNVADANAVHILMLEDAQRSTRDDLQPFSAEPAASERQLDEGNGGVASTQIRHPALYAEDVSQRCTALVVAFDEQLVLSIGDHDRPRPARRSLRRAPSCAVRDITRRRRTYGRCCRHRPPITSVGVRTRSACRRARNAASQALANQPCVGPPSCIRGSAWYGAS